MNRGTWKATVHRVTKGQTQLKQLGTHEKTPINISIFPLKIEIGTHVNKNLLFCYTIIQIVFMVLHPRCKLKKKKVALLYPTLKNESKYPTN